MVERRKGIGYIIEALSALLVLFIFVLGNTPTEPATDWNNFQKNILSQDLTLVMEKTGDADDFIRNGETGTMMTMMDTLSQDRLSVSGSVENVPISTQIVGFHTIEDNRTNISFSPVQDLNDQCYQQDSLEEIEPAEGEIMRSDDSRDDTYLYIADTDPDISGGNDEIDYDSLWADNGTRCQFSAAEGPHYLNEFFYWGNSTGEDHFDINKVYNDSNELELFLANQASDLRPALTSRMNGIETGIVVDTVAVDRGGLEGYDILVFSRREAIPDLNDNEEKIQQFLEEGSLLMMVELRKQDFYIDLGTSPELADNFITSTGLKWVDLGYSTPISDPAGASFSETASSRELGDYFQGFDGDPAQIELRPAGKISSSNGIDFKNSAPIVATRTGSYDTEIWNATNYNMDTVDPDTVEGYVETDCVGSSESTALTEGEFDFHDYQTDSYQPYSVISVQLGAENSCSDNYARAVEIDIDGDGEYTDGNEGPFLSGEQVRVENKTFTVNFPNQEALETGDAVEFVYNGENEIESINYRNSFPGFQGQRLARMEYKSSYSAEEKKMVSAVVHWLSDENTQFGNQRNVEISTEAIGGVKENTFIPYRISMRWK